MSYHEKRQEILRKLNEKTFKARGLIATVPLGPDNDGQRLSWNELESCYKAYLECVKLHNELRNS